MAKAERTLAELAGIAAGRATEIEAAGRSGARALRRVPHSASLAGVLLRSVTLIRRPDFRANGTQAPETVGQFDTIDVSCQKMM
jgi:hypothetical protein